MWAFKLRLFCMQSNLAELRYLTTVQETFTIKTVPKHSRVVAGVSVTRVRCMGNLLSGPCNHSCAERVCYTNNARSFRLFVEFCEARGRADSHDNFIRRCILKKVFIEQRILSQNVPLAKMKVWRKRYWTYLWDKLVRSVRQTVLAYLYLPV